MHFGLGLLAGLAGRAAELPRQRAGRRLVWRDLDSLDNAMLVVLWCVIFIVREVTNDKPLVDLRIFRNRNFLMGCVLICYLLEGAFMAS